jgi:hypothetical protein
VTLLQPNVSRVTLLQPAELSPPTPQASFDRMFDRSPLQAAH